MSLKAKYHKVVRKIKGQDEGTILVRGITNITENMTPEEKLGYFQKLFFICRGAWDQSVLNEREEIYDGTHEVDKNRNNKNTNTDSKQSNQVYNIVYEFLESEVDNTIPQPSIKSKLELYQEQAKMIEDSLKNDLLDSKINKINDKNERTTFKHGFSAAEIVWNPDIKHHLYRGDIELRIRHPKQIIPQVGIWDLDKMNYYITIESITKQDVWIENGVSLTNETEQFPEVNTVGAQLYSNNQLEKVSRVTFTYKDEDGDIGRFVYVMNKVIKDEPKMFYRRPHKCDKCGEAPEDSKSKKCKCGGKIVTKVEFEETLIEDVVLKRTEKSTDPTTGKEIEKPVVIPKGTKIPYYAPTSFPLIVRINVPTDFGFGGQSDVDTIRDQYMALSKVLNNIEEKILRGGNVITALDDHKFSLSNTIYEVIRGNQAQLAALDVKSLNADIQKDLEYAQYLYKSAQSELGITNSFQGKDDKSNQSGKAIQAKINQSSGRMMSKQYNKFDFYKQLFQMMFEFKLAFYDELRPYIAKDNQGNDIYSDFSKYEFLIKDDDGKWYYNTDFLFTVDNGGGFLSDKGWIYTQSLALYSQHALEASDSSVKLWNILDSINFPLAGQIKEELAEQLEQQKQMQAQQAEMQKQQMLMQQQKNQPPQEQQPQQEQQALQIDVEQILSHMSPEEQQQFAQLNPQQQQEMIMKAVQGGQ